MRDYGPMLYGVAYRLTGNESDARDLVQDTLIKVNRSLHTFEPGSFSRWVYRILHNTFLDQVRRRQRIRMQSLPEDESRFDRAELAPDPEAALAQYRLDEEIQQAIDELPPTSRQRSSCATSSASDTRRSQIRPASRSGRCGRGSTAAVPSSAFASPTCSRRTLGER